MGVLGRVLAGGNLNDERMWTPSDGAYPTLSGVQVDAQKALSISAFWRAVTLLAGTIGQLPLILYRRTADDGKERAPEHPLYGLLHTSPNQWQTAMDFKEMLTGHAILRGHGYAEIIAGRRGPVDQLVPRHPDRVREVWIELDGAPYRVYDYLERNGRTRRIPDEDMFVVSGPFGMSLVDIARESLGMMIAGQQLGAAMFGKGLLPSGAIQTDKRVDDKGRANLREAINEMHQGSDRAGEFLLLDDGMKWTQLGLKASDAQFIETMQFTVSDVARWTGVPEHKLSKLDRSTNNNIEHQGIEWVVDGVMPWAVRWEQPIDSKLIVASDRYFAEFLVTGLMRGDTLSRYQAYAIAIQWGWMSPNDVRRLENMNPIPGGDVYLRPLNMVPSTSPFTNGGQAGGQATMFQVLDGKGRALLADAGAKRLAAMARDAAKRVMRKELGALSKLARDTQATGPAWEQGVREFYDTHAAFVAGTLQIPLPDARQWARNQRDELLADGASALVKWEEQDRAADLASIATLSEVMAA